MWKIFYHGKFHKLFINDENPNKEEIKIIPKYIGICGTDKNIYLGKKKVNEPLVIGHEISGITVDGNKVVVFPNYWCGKCKNCKKGFYNSCRNKISIGVNTNGGLAEWINVPKQYVFKIPEDLDLRLGALVEPTAVAFSALRKINTNIEDIIVIGGGSIGSLISIVAKVLGFKPIILEKDPRKIERLKQKGLPATYDIEEDFDAQIAIIDTVNSRESIALSLKLLQGAVANSQLIITGLDEENIILNRDIIVRNEIIVEGSIIYTPADFSRSIQIIDKNKEIFSKIIDKIADSENINDWFKAYVIDEPNLKVLISLNN